MSWGWICVITGILIFGIAWYVDIVKPKIDNITKKENQKS